MLKRIGKDKCWIFTEQSSEEGSYTDVCLKTMFCVLE